MKNIEEGKKIREKRESMNLSRKKLAKQLGVSEHNLVKWEAGHQPMEEEDRVKMKIFIGEAPEKKVKVNGSAVPDEDFREKYYTLLEKYTALLEKK